MGRSVLDALPDWALIFVFVIGTVIVAISGAVSVRRFAPSWLSTESQDSVAAAAGMVMTFFALVVAFEVVNLYTSYEGASTSVAAEANSLNELAQNALVFPATERGRIDTAITHYIVEVRTHEFAILRSGGQDPHAEQLLDDVVHSVQAYSPTTQTQIAFYDASVSQLSSLVTERQNRLDHAESSIPISFAILIILLAIVSIAVSLFLRTHHRWLDLTLVAGLAIVIGAGIVTVLMLQYPFSGSLAVSSDAFTRGMLGLLLHAHP
jgi:hypothetical protein